MKTSLITVILISMVIYSQGCTTLKRYRSIRESGTNDTLADIDLFGFRLSQAKPEKSNKSLWDLSADAQSQFIKILNTRYPDNQKFLSSLSFEYMKGKDELLPEDYVSKDLRLIFSVGKKRDYPKNRTLPGIKLSPADRLEYLKISLEIPEKSKLRFTGWNMYTTEYGSIDIADISFNRSLDLEAGASLTSKKEPVGGDVSAGGKSSGSRKEDQAIKYRYLKLNGKINEKKVEMEEEGTREIDLTGNIAADISLTFEKFPGTLTRISGLKDSTGKFNDPDKMVMHCSEVVVPMMEDIKDTIEAVLKMNYVYRNVTSGRRTFPEWDDRVKYYKGSVKKTIPLFTARDYVPDLYCIGIDSVINSTSNSPSIIKKKVMIEGADNGLYELTFRTYEEATAFYEWLKYYFSRRENQGKTINIEGQMLKYKNNYLIYQQIKGDSRFRVLSYY
jgi:hypothetical protein